MIQHDLDAVPTDALLRELLQRSLLRLDHRCAYCERAQSACDAEPCRFSARETGPLLATFGAYQAESMRNHTSRGPRGHEHNDMQKTLLLAATGLAGECGEVVDLIKKHCFHEAPLNREKLVLEGGDVLWYLALLCLVLDTDLSEMASANALKLRKRFPGEWSPEAQRAKADEAPPAPPTKPCCVCDGAGRYPGSLRANVIAWIPCERCKGTGVES